MDELLAAVRRAFGAGRLPGLEPGLIVHDESGWIPATALTGGDVTLLQAAARRRWDARPHVAAALMWKAYSYWLSLPAAFGWVAGRRVLHVTASQVLVRLDAPDAPVRIGVRPGTPFTEGDPLALRSVLLDHHVTPLLDAFQREIRINRRPLLGSLAAGLAHATRHAVRAVPGATTADIDILLKALDLHDLISWEDGHLRRRTCCLAFTLPEPKICTDCCYRPQPS
ncbi:hypothetical protein [Paractinoplanes brasiliensis]|uniref:Ferric iron reductase FhuF-like transporter n=1 Tax=Paractinoplanes brasiliensis TaxID=52695 RepID=A0A4R6JAF9_9ACTN|nr:hypothetical protein [Actinoplanes brasiliensis]TDO32654.1 hypothetical protein C8E87_8124 [Actinoplanes brasiliensis]GID32786.1 hypothetical protein Abr02nite_77690 [Actinoplanes brasiliensis]